MAQPLTEQEIAWFDTPVSVQVEPDNQRWLDAMLEMKPDELRQYAVFQYQIPQSAVLNGSRDDIMQLIVLANKVGGGGSVIRSRYRYIPGLAGILPPAITSRRGRYLYLTRGIAPSIQVFSTETKEWIALSTLGVDARPLDRKAQRAAELAAEQGAGFVNEYNPAAERAKQRTDVGAATTSPKPSDPDTDNSAPDETPVNPAASVAFNAVLVALPKMARAQLEEVASSLGAQDVSEAKFPTNGDLKAYITNAIEVQTGGNAALEGGDTDV